MFFLLFVGGFDISSCVFYYVNETKTWQEAQSYCRANYIDLATTFPLALPDGIIKHIRPSLSVYFSFYSCHLSCRLPWPHLTQACCVSLHLCLCGASIVLLTFILLSQVWIPPSLHTTPTTTKPFEAPPPTAHSVSFWPT